MTTKTKGKLPKAKFRVGQIVSISHDFLKHKVKSKYWNLHGHWEYYLTNISGGFAENQLTKGIKIKK